MSKGVRLCLWLAVAVLVSVSSRAADDYALRLYIHNVFPTKGQLLLAVCRKEQFLTADCTYRTIVPVQADPQIITVPDDALPVGQYAVQIIHDRNMNAALDRNLLGIPREPVGFSRDASGRMGPPAFEQAAFEYEGQPMDLTIHLY